MCDIVDYSTYVQVDYQLSIVVLLLSIVDYIYVYKSRCAMSYFVKLLQKRHKGNCENVTCLILTKFIKIDR